MQIYFERRGGFLGTTLKTAVDTAQLPTEEAKDWERVLSTGDFKKLPPKVDSMAEIDQFSYKMTVVTNEWQHTAEFTDVDASEELQPLIRRLTLIARQTPRQNSTDR
ncbi:MAG: protealysin inhibitor emfourin [Candidatus Promineifilaceae bacterium]|nr:protealysin inhibitor emfourin [Candidatus Promineifilaceae bacterium]